MRSPPLSVVHLPALATLASTRPVKLNVVARRRTAPRREAAYPHPIVPLPGLRRAQRRATAGGGTRNSVVTLSTGSSCDAAAEVRHQRVAEGQPSHRVRHRTDDLHAVPL